MVQGHVAASGILVMVFFEPAAYNMFPALISPCLLANKGRGRVAAAGTFQSNSKSSKEYSFLCFFFLLFSEAEEEDSLGLIVRR